MELLHPGVYIQEVASGVRPLEGVSTSTAAFLGVADSGPVDDVVMVTSFIEYQSIFGGFRRDGYLTHAALHFFANGGRRLYVARVASEAKTSSVKIGDRREPAGAAITVTATSPGLWGNDLDVTVADATLDEAGAFRLSVSRAGAPVESYDELSVDPSSPTFAETVVNTRSSLIRVAIDADADDAEAGTSKSGANPATSLPAGQRSLTIDVNGDGPRTVELGDSVGTAEEIATAIQAAVRTLNPLRSTTPATTFSAFTAVSADGQYVLTSGAPDLRSSVRVGNSADGNAAGALRLGVTNGGVEAVGSSVLRPAAGSYLLGDGVVSGATLAVTAGDDGSTLQDNDYLKAFARLDPVADVNILAVPGIGSKAVVDAGSGYCAQRADCFFIGDLPSTADTTQTAREFVSGLTVKNSFVAVYFPWLTMVDPLASSPDPVPVPPSGFVAGMYARTDARRGVWKAPAGTEANISGAVGLATTVTDAQQDTLNPLGLNAIRFFPSAGLVLWGARTLALSDPEYRYIPVRRLAIFLERSIYNGIQWAVFEPNDEDLWASLRMNISAFMMTQFRAGAFQGDTPAKAFIVKCDAETNPPDQVNAGIVTAQVAFAPLRPAEFVVIRISQKTAESAA
ncbi:MAG: phage tail sheath subtilisin-like domain-containing protein [Actinomycetota bacterium]|nr:phage tail sheath subtilisin-like domain-containing protein [Actinomycetota bacterium]